MKFLAKLFAFALAVVTVFAFSACNNEKAENKNEQFGWAFEVESEVVNKDDKDVNVLTIKGFYVAPGTMNEVNSGIAQKIKLVVGRGSFNVYNEEKGDFQFDKDGKTETDVFDKYDEIIIDRDVFANQKLIGSVEITDRVTEIGIAAFAGCSNITKMTIPFIGVKANNVYNADKTFAALFGTTESEGCTSVTVTYNEGNTASYYIPSGLTEVVVSYSKDTMIPAYAFAGNTIIEKVSIGNVVEVGKSAFMGCTALTTVNFGDAADLAKIKTIGSEAFSGCSALYGLNLSAFSFETVCQKAFEGCSKLGLGYDLVTLPAANYMERAFANCTSLKAIDFANVKSLGDYCFLGCSALETLTNIDGMTLNTHHLFAECTKLIEAGKVDELGNYNVA